MVTTTDHDPLRTLVRRAISTEWHRRIAEQTADSPDGHIDALTSVVVLALAKGYADPHPWQEYNHHGNTCHYPGCRLSQEEHTQSQHDGARQGSQMTRRAQR